MVAFSPISSDAARRMLVGIDEAEKNAILGDFVSAGLIKAYARVIETKTPDGWNEVRDARIDRSIWRRILDEGKIADVWATASARLESEGLVGGRPAINVIGIRFDERGVVDAAIKHIDQPSPNPLIVTQIVSPVAQAKAQPIVAEVVEEATAPMIELAPEAAPAMIGLPEDVLSVSIKDAMAILGVGNTTIYKPIGEGLLTLVKVGRRSRIQAAGIRVMLGTFR